MEAVEELVDVIPMAVFLQRESGNLGKLPPANFLEKPADLWNFFEVRRKWRTRSPSRSVDELAPIVPSCIVVFFTVSNNDFDVRCQS